MKQIKLVHLNNFKLSVFIVNDESYWQLNSFILSNACKYASGCDFKEVESICCRLDYSEQQCFEELVKSVFVGSYFVIEVIE